jgi:hypothetical protein
VGIAEEGETSVLSFELSQVNCWLGLLGRDLWVSRKEASLYIPIQQTARAPTAKN